MNLRPSGYEPDELPGCSIPRHQESDIVPEGSFYKDGLTAYGGLLHPATKMSGYSALIAEMQGFELTFLCKTIFSAL